MDNKTTQDTLPPPQNQLERVKTDPRFSQFFQQEFDVSKYIRDLLKAPSLSDSSAEPVSTSSSADSTSPTFSQSGELTRAVSELEGVIKREVVNHKKPLLRQALHVIHLEQWLNHVKTHVSSFGDHFERVKSSLKEPFEASENKAKQIERAHKASRLLRSCHMFLILIERLKNSLGVKNHSKTDVLNENGENSAGNSTTHSNASDVHHSFDLIQASELVSEIIALYENEELNGIQIVEMELPWISQLKQVLQYNATQWIIKMSTPDHTTHINTNMTTSLPNTQATRFKGSNHISVAPKTNLIEKHFSTKMLEIPTLSIAIHILFSLNALDKTIRIVVEEWKSESKTILHSAFTVPESGKKKPSNTRTQNDSTIRSSLVDQRQDENVVSADQQRLQLWSQMDDLFRVRLPTYMDRMILLHKSLVSLWKKVKQQNSTLRSRTPETIVDQSQEIQNPSFKSHQQSLYSFLSYLTLGEVVENSEKNSENKHSKFTSPDPLFLIKHVWVDLMEKEMAEVISNSVKKSKLIEQVLGTEFPRFLQLFHSLADRVVSQLELSGINVASLISSSLSLYEEDPTKQNITDSTSNSQIEPIVAQTSSSTETNPSNGQITKSSSSTSPESVTSDSGTKQIQNVSVSRLHPKHQAVISLFDRLMGSDVWNRLSTALQPLELEYQKILVTQFFTPINGMFASAPTFSASRSNDEEYSSNWDIFGNLGISANQKQSQAGKQPSNTTFVGGRYLLPGEIILALPSKSSSNSPAPSKNQSNTSGSSSTNIGGRWVGGSHYLCKWITIVKAHFDSLQSSSLALHKNMIPKFLLALNKSIKLFMLKTEEVLCHDETASQVTDNAPLTQRFNASIFNSLSSLHSFLNECIYIPIVLGTSLDLNHAKETSNGLSASKEDERKSRQVALSQGLHELAKSLNGLSLLASKNIMDPIFHRETKLIEKTLLVDLHQADWISTSGIQNSKSSTSTSSSIYLRNLQRLLNHFITSIIPMFSSSLPYPGKDNKSQTYSSEIQTRIRDWLDSSSSSMIEFMCKELSAKISAMFVSSASLIRPIGDSGKLRLVNDIAQLEQLLHQLETIVLNNHTKSDDLVQNRSRFTSSIILRAFREVLFADTKELVAASLEISSHRSTESGSTSNLIVDIQSAIRILHPSVICQLLISRAPLRELVSPHVFKGMSMKQYVDWSIKSSPQQTWQVVEQIIQQAEGKQNNPDQLKDNEDNTKVIIAALKQVGPCILSSK